MGLYRRKDSAVWWMSFTANGRQFQQSTQTTDKKIAEVILGSIKTKIVENKFFDKDDSSEIRLSEMIEKYDEQYTNEKSYYSKARDKSIFKHLQAYFGEKATLTDVAERLGEYEVWRKKQKTKRGSRPDSGTIRKELRLMGRMFNVARKRWKWRVSNPINDIELPSDSAERMRYLSWEELKRLMAALNESDHAWLPPLVGTALLLGLREGNLISLQKNEVLDGTVFISSEKMKNEDYLGAPMSERARALLEYVIANDITDSPLVFHYDGGKPLYQKKIERAFKKVLTSADITNFRFHDLRHTFASILRQNGASLEAIASLLGHKDLRMTLRYAKLNLDAMKPTVNIMDEAITKNGLADYDVFMTGEDTKKTLPLATP